jgi:hypothetical protein
MKIHYIHGCRKGRYPDGYLGDDYLATKDLDAVTCKTCINQIIKKNLQPRASFPDVPTFEVTPEDRIFHRGRPDGCHLAFICPICGVKIIHGGYYEKPGSGDGHRVTHCGCWERGYYIKEIHKNS